MKNVKMHFAWWMSGCANYVLCICAVAVAFGAAGSDVPDFVTKDATFWLDASALEATAGTELSSWADVRGGSCPVATTYTTTKPQVIEIADGDLAGKKAVTFFDVGTQCDMQFPSVYTIKTAFFVVDIDLSADAYLLGGPNNGRNNYTFARGTGGNYGTVGSYRYGALSSTVKYWNDGVAVSSPTTTTIPTGYQLITWEFSTGGRIKYLCSDRQITARNGGKRLCEVVTFSRTLSDVERAQMEGYLKAKWFGGQTTAVATLEMVGKKAQVHFDASVASSFHYGENGTSVTQWDDLSGNDRHFTASAIGSASIVYGTVGTVAEKPVYDSGAVNSGIDMKIPSQINSRTIFMVAEVDRVPYLSWLGSYSTYMTVGRMDCQYAHQDASIGCLKGGETWCNGGKVSNNVSMYPELPGGLSVYVFRTTADCPWQCFGNDRNIANRNGAKRMAELITFSGSISDSDRETVEALLMEKWAPSDEYVDAVIATAPVHVDVSSSENFNYTDDKITGWKNSGGADLFRQDVLYKDKTALTPYYGTYGFTNGVPAFQMGPAGSNIDMAFTRLTNVRSVFWAMDIVRNGIAHFLGDYANAAMHSSANVGTTYHFCRDYDNHYYAHSRHAQVAFKNGPMTCDGVPVMPTSEKPPLGTHIYDVQLSAGLTASALSQDRWCYRNDVMFNGGRAISELIVFTNVVSGLTRKAINDRLAAKWTKSCGWAGEGDSDWGEENYRVFGSDATVPAEGASAAGVGFTSSATMSGGALSLGKGGIFASEGAAVTISNTIEGHVGAFGPGTVTVTAPLSAVTSLSVGYGSTLTLKASVLSVAEGLSLQGNSRLVIDVSDLAERAYAAISFPGVALPDGGSVLDYVSLSDDSIHLLTLSADGTKIEINSPNAPLTAVWTAAAGTDVQDTANWTCFNLNNSVISDILPSAQSTTSVTFEANCDLRTLGAVGFMSGVTLDLHGHVVKVSDLDAGCPNAKVVNSVSDTAAELHVEVPSGSTFTNATVSVAGNVKFVKDGTGTLVATKTGQSYTGGTEVTAGVFAMGTGAKHNAYSKHYVGPSLIRVTTNGTDVGTLALNGAYAEAQAKNDFVLAGGTLRNATDVEIGLGQITNITLEADSAIVVNGNFALWWDTYDTMIDLGGHTLSMGIKSGKVFYLANTTIKNGVFNITSGGRLQCGALINSKEYYDEIVATNADLRVNAALTLLAPLSVRSYEAVYAANANSGTAAMKVYGTFKPTSDYFYGCTMQDGSTIDLSGKTGAWSTTSSSTSGSTNVTFEAGAKVTINLAGRTDLESIADSDSPYVVTWAEEPSNVTFVPDAQTRSQNYRLSPRAGGLALIHSMMIIIIR